jgi:uncharacterized protein (TIGR00299 family) protein
MMAFSGRPATVVLDPLGGASGDMFIAALLDAFPALAEPVLAAMRAGGLPESVTVEIGAAKRGGIAAKALRFSGAAPAPTGTYADFRRRIETAAVSPPIRDHALAILERLGAAEAAVHAIPLERVHFHEIADWDTQADIIGAAAIAEALGGTAWRCRPLPPGTGTVRTAHGILPLPAPATAHLLTGFAFRAEDGVTGERVTPTGAAILAHLVDPGATLPGGRLVATGAGAGAKEFPGLANILRVLAFAHDDMADESVLTIEFEIDDASPEELATGLEHLRATPGVRDVASFAGLGKKGRWLQSVRVLAEPRVRDAVAAAIFRETTTLGFRIRRDERVVLARETVTVEDAAGPVRVKRAVRPDGVTAKAEADDVAGHAHGAGGRVALRARAERQALDEENGHEH